LEDVIRWGWLVFEDKVGAALFIGEIESKGRASLGAGVFLPLAYLCEAFALNRFERHCLYLALLPELDISFESAFAGLHGEEDRRLMSAEAAFRLYDDKGGKRGKEDKGGKGDKDDKGGKSDKPQALRALLASDRTLRRFLLTASGSSGRSDLAVSWKLAGRIKEFVVDNVLDSPALAGFTWLWEPGGEPVPRSMAAVAGTDAVAGMDTVAGMDVVAKIDAVARMTAVCRDEGFSDNENSATDEKDGFLDDEDGFTDEEDGFTDEEDDAVARMEDFLALAVEREADGASAAILLCGPEGSGKKRQILRFAERAGQAVLFVDVEKMEAGRDLNENMLNVLCRESVLRQCVLCFDGLDALSQYEHNAEPIAASMLEGALKVANLVFATCRSPLQMDRHRFGRRLLDLTLTIPDEDRRRSLWRRLSAKYRISPLVVLDEFADKFLFTPGQIEGVLAEAEKLAYLRGIGDIDQLCLDESCYSRIGHDLDGTKAMKVPAVFVWEDLILPPVSKELLRLACDQVRYKHTVYNRWGFGAKLPYGRGVSLLFSGPPGTGKTMAAQVVANELRMELYKVDLAGVVSKYIGETEKNLQEIFREAKKSQAILFFDEADVLFSKRTEVKEANDKYSNMEAAFMLQKIEEYEGVSILATNFLQNFDEAFKRRMKFVVEFPFPNEEYRLLLWKAVFPLHTPLGEDIDREYLSRRFELSGSSIKNIALNASFMAAAGEKTVTMTEILTALRNEMAKSGIQVSRDEFGEYYMLVR
jgi:SpoVK/Ycf46/Vps4 family AAA+-type ATPase